MQTEAQTETGAAMVKMVFEHPGLTVKCWRENGEKKLEITTTGGPVKLSKTEAFTMVQKIMDDMRRFEKTKL